MSGREIDDEILTLSASGWTYGTRFVLYDYQTESMWFCMDSTCAYTCISGFYADRRLEKFSSEKTVWSEWKDRYPATGYAVIK